MKHPWPEAIVDADGHVIEDISAIRAHLPEAYLPRVKTRLASTVFPGLDHMHHFLAQSLPGAFEPKGPAEWSQFVDTLGLEASVLYPTSGLAIGTMVDVDLAIATARAYNDWLHEAYASHDRRLKGMALIPMQDPEAAVEELRRAVTELGFVGAMLPARGLKSHHGDKVFWPVYAEADRLGCALAVHGGVLSGMGFDQFDVFAATHALGHPVSIMISFASIVMGGLLERFPNVRFGFLEGGVGWFIAAMERLSGSYKAFVPTDPQGRYLQLGGATDVATYVVQHIEAGRVFVGVEGDEPSLPWAVRAFGPEAFVFSSDFPHEVNIESCRHEIEELVENDEITTEAKQAIFATNARRFYGLDAGAGR